MCDRRRDLRSIAREVGIKFGSVQAILNGSPDSWLTTRNGPGLTSFVSLRGWTWFYLPDRNSGWNMGPSLRSRIQKTEHAVEAPWLTPPKKFKRVPSAGKIMASIFWDSQGILMIDYLEQGRTINGTHYADKLRRLRQEIARKRRGKLTQSVLLLHDNAPAPTSHVAMAAATDCGVWNSSPSPIFSGLSLLWLLPVSETKKPSFVLEAMKMLLGRSMCSLRTKIESSILKG
jgi:hypothetical protein